MTLETFTAETFRDRRGETFRMNLDDSTGVDTELVEISLGREESTAARRTPFSLVFRAPMETVVPQRIYALEHAELGRFEVFLVPIGPDEIGMRYEAVFT